MFGREVAALHFCFSNEMFRVNHLLTRNAVNSLLNPIMRHDMQARSSMLHKIQ